jgi:hypothetical protein
MAASLLPERATPYTWSILGLSAERTVRDYFARQGHQLPNRTIWRYHNGSVEVDVGVLAAAQQVLVGQGVTPAPSMGQLLLRRGQDRGSGTVTAAGLADAPERFVAVENWTERVYATQWRQATVLQVMEEIEPRAQAALTGLLEVSMALAIAGAQIRQWFPEQASALLYGLDQEIATVGYRSALGKLGAPAAADSGAMAWFRAGHALDWQDELPGGDLRVALEQFLALYGRWAAEPLEAGSPRWAEVPAALVNAALASELVPDPQAARQQREKNAEAASRQLGMLRRRQLESTFQQVQQLAELVAEGQAALVNVIAAARYWALGAGHEAVADGRLAAVGDVFLLELEELKQMMTGEWHSAGQVRSVVEDRRGSIWS